MKKGLRHGSEEWGGKGLGTQKIKHEKGVVLRGSQEWGGKGLGRLKMKLGCFSWFPRVGWEGFGKAKNEA